MRGVSAVAVLALSFPLAGCATARMPPTVLGRTVSLQLDGSSRLQGELLAVDDGRLVLRDKLGAREVPLTSIRSVRVKRHDWGGRRGMIWTLAGGAVTGAALTASCATVSNGCGGVGVSTMVLWLAIGGLSSLAMESASQFRVREPTKDELRRYARFPQGLPAGLDLQALMSPRLPSPPSPAPSPER